MIYLDNNATTQPTDAVNEAMAQANGDLWANPSSVHRLGQQVRQRLELARVQVATLLSASPRTLVFTSGGTESNNLAIRGMLDRTLRHDRPGVLVTTSVEHAAVRGPAQAYHTAGGTVVPLRIDHDGRVDLADAARTLAQVSSDGKTVLMSVQWANNETGVIQPIEALTQLTADLKHVFFHVDATQAVGKIPVNVQATAVDLLSFSGHKFHGPKGAGGLYVRRGVRLAPQQPGGPQEHDLRGGTENTPGILGLAVAAQQAGVLVSDTHQIDALRRLRDRFEQQICRALPKTVINGAGAPRLWNTTNLGFVGLEAEAILLGLSERGICASAGAACSSGSLDPSPVLLAMGVPEPVAHGSVRFSLSRDTTSEELDQAAGVVVEVVGRLAQTFPVGT